VHEGWIDTGSPLTLLPQVVWEPAARRPLATGLRVAVGGTSVAADLAELYLALADEHGAATPPLRVRAYCCFSSAIPILLGVEDLLTRCVLNCDGPAGAAFLDFP